MSKIIIYPNNSVDIDNEPAFWTSDDFKKHNISLFRENHSNNECEKFIENGNEYVIFFTLRLNSQIKKIKRRGIINIYKKRRSHNETYIGN